MAKTIPRSYVFVLAKQRNGGGPMRDKRQKRDKEPEEFDINDEFTTLELIQIRHAFIKSYHLVEEDVYLDGDFFLNENCFLCVRGDNSKLDLPEEFQGLKVLKK